MEWLVGLRGKEYRPRAERVSQNICQPSRLARPLIGVTCYWSLTTLREKLIKIGAKVVTHSRYVIFQMAEVAVPRWLFRAILERIQRLRPREPVPG